MKFTRPFNKILIPGIILVLSAIIAMIAITIDVSQKINDSAKRVTHTQEVLFHSQKLFSLAVDNETGSRGYIITGNKMFLASLEKSQKEIYQILAELNAFTSDNPDQQIRIDSLSLYIDKRIAFSNGTIDTYDLNGANAAIARVNTGEGKFHTDRIRFFVDKIQTTENALLEQHKGANDQAVQWLNNILVALTIALLLLVIILLLLIRFQFFSLNRNKDELKRQVHVKTGELNNVFERITDAFVAMDNNWCFTYMNKKAGEILGREPAMMEGKNIWNELPEGVDQPFYKTYHLAMEQQQYIHVEEYYEPYDRWFENHIYPSPDGLSVFFRDITETKKAEEKLAQNEKRFRALIENNFDIISLNDDKLNLIYRSPSSTRITGWTDEDMKNIKGTIHIHPDDREQVKAIIGEAIKNPGKPFPYLFRYIHKDGHYMWLEGTATKLPQHEYVNGLVFNSQDVTEHKIAEEKIQKANRLYFFISQINQMIVRTTDETTLFKEACRIAVDLGQFRMAWIGMLDEATKRVIPVMHAGEEEGYLSKIKIISVADEPEGRGPTGTALREGKYIICNDIENDPQMVPWKEAALGRGYLSLMALPIIKFGQVIGAFTFYADVKNFFDAEEIALLEEASGDVSFALEVFEKERQHKKAEEALKESEELLRLSSELASVAAWEYDVESNFMLRSANHDKLYGLENLGKWERETFIGATHPDDREKCNSMIDDSLAIGGPDKYKFDFRIIYPDKTIHWLNVIGEITERNPEGFGKKIRGFITDITERKEAELAVEESEEKYRSLIEQAADGITILDQQGNLLEMNGSFLKMMGYNKTEITKITIRDLIPEEELNNQATTLIQMVVGGIRFYERMLKRKDGTIFIAEINARMAGNGLLVAFVRDITDRKKAEDAIKQSEEKYRSLVEQAIDGIIQIDANGTTTLVNTALCKMLGYTKEEFMKLNIEDTYVENEKHLARARREQATKTGSISFERMMIGKDRTEVPVEFSIVKMGNGQLLGMVRDITQRKKAEAEIRKVIERFEMIARTTNDALWEWNIETGELWANQMHQHLYGLTVADPVPTMEQWMQKIHPADRERILATQQQTLASDKSGWISEYRFEANDKGYIDIYDRCYIVRNNMGKPIRLTGSVTDITERIKTEEVIKESEEKFRTLVQQAADGIVIVDQEGNYLEVNESMTKLTGYSISELTKMNGSQIVEAEDLRKTPLQLEKIKMGNPVMVERIIVKKDGTLRNVEISAKLMHNGKVICIMRDITDRKKTEAEIRKAIERYKLIGKAANDAVWEWNLETNEFWGNEIHMNLYGLTKADPEPGDGEWKRRLNDDDRERMLQTIDDALASDVNSFDAEYRLYTENKGWRTIYGRNYIERNAAGKAIRMLGSMMDITERKKTEEEIQKLATIVERSPEFIGIAGLDAKVIYLNEGGKKMVGLDADITTTSMWDYFAPPDLEIFQTKAIPAIQKAGRWVGDINMKNFHTGELIPVWMDLFYILHPQTKEPIAYATVTTDITERKKTEKVIIESEERFSAIFKAAPGSMMLFSLPDGKVVEVNDNFSQITGYTRMEAIGRNTSELRMWADPADREKYLALLDKQGIVTNFEADLNHKSGIIVHGLVSGHIITIQGKKYLLGVFYDITDRKKAEEELKTTNERLLFHLDNSPLGYIEWDKNLFVKTWSKRTEEIFGWTEKEFKEKQKNGFSLVYEEDISELSVLAKQLMDGSVARNHIVHRNYTKSGKLIWCEWFNSVSEDKDGNVVTIMSLVKDITERKAAEEKIIYTTEQLRQLTAHLQTIREEERKHIGREIHDELGQQLTAIKMDAVWIDKKMPDENTPIKNKLKNIIALLDGSNQSVRKILNELRPGNLENQALTETMEWQGRQFTESTGIPIKFASTETNLRLSEATATCLFRVYQESLTNIMKYAEANKVSALLSLQGDHIILTVEDDGVGFDTSQIKDKKTFGLLGMRERVISLNGTFELISAKGKGTKIVVNLPYKI